MIARYLMVAAAFLLGGCASRLPSEAHSVHTLAGDRRLPAGYLEKQFSPTQWLKLRDLEYDAFVVLDAEVRADGSLRIGHVRERFPDESWDDLARSFGKEATLRAANVGSHIDPQAEVCVIFFKRAFDGNLVLIFAQQKDDPPPGMTQKALYLHTAHYERG